MMPPLRMVTCGSVDDGKSTLIGRLLYNSHNVFDDQLAALEKDSRRFGTTGDELDFSLLLDGLRAEREQGITIDVAYRYFSTARRRFIVADAPGHPQYTRNMATGASTADLAVLLVDARSGLLPQTRRHAHIVALFGIRHVVLAVNKLDLIDFDEARYQTICDQFAAFAEPFEFRSIAAIPIAARFGDNVVASSERTPWYDGPALLPYLESVDVEATDAGHSLRLPIQWVNRAADFRGFAGTIAAGRVAPGDEVVVARSGQCARIERVVSFDGDVAGAGVGEAVTVTLDTALDISRGDVLAAPGARPHVSDQFAAHLLWLGADELLPGRSYLLKIGAETVAASVGELKHRVDIDDPGKHLAAKTLVMNEIGFCNLALAEPVAFDPYADNRTMGSFILIDRHTNATVGAGMIRFGLRRADNIHRQALSVTRDARAHLKGQRPCVLWFTGLSGAGKSTIANLVDSRLLSLGRHTYLLDGDNVRHGLNRDLGFTDVDRVENIRRVAEVSKLFADAGLIVLVAFISPFRADRQAARDAIGDGEFIEIFVDAPLAVAEKRDPKGLYRKARAGQIRHFTGVDSPYEAPASPELHLDTTSHDPMTLAERVIDLLRLRGYLEARP